MKPAGSAPVSEEPAHEDPAVAALIEAQPWHHVTAEVGQFEQIVRLVRAADLSSPEYVGDSMYARGVSEGLRRAENVINFEQTCLNCAQQLGDLYEERQKGFTEGLAEGRRQATEGWEREWAVDQAGDRLEARDEKAARWFASRAPGRVVVSRLVAPWEPAEQPEGSERGE
jgi:hypothetical protein